MYKLYSNKYNSIFINNYIYPLYKVLINNNSFIMILKDGINYLHSPSQDLNKNHPQPDVVVAQVFKSLQSGNASEHQLSPVLH